MQLGRAGASSSDVRDARVLIVFALADVVHGESPVAPRNSAVVASELPVALCNSPIAASELRAARAPADVFSRATGNVARTMGALVCATDD
jgi:hypothetical protein